MRWIRASWSSVRPGNALRLAEQGDVSRSAPAAGRRVATSICVVSGKGGTGKSLVSASLSAYLARDRRVLQLDADFGAGNAHILHDVSPARTMVDVVRGASIEEALVACRPRLDLLGGGSGHARMASLHPSQLARVARELERLDRSYDALVIDSAAGLSMQTIAFAAAADLVLVVTNPDVTALTDAYAFLKVLYRHGGASSTALIVNRTHEEREVEHVAERIGAVARKYLGVEPRCLGGLPEDRAAFRSIQRRVPVLDGEPDSELGRAIERIAARVADEVQSLGGAGFGARMRNQVPA